MGNSVVPFRVEQRGMIETAEDFTRLNLIDWGRSERAFESVSEAIAVIGSWVVGTCAYAVCRGDLRTYPERDDWPGWDHMGDHPRLGRLLWNHFYHEHHGPQDRLVMSDAPDFYGEFHDGEHLHCLWGDIGHSCVGATGVPCTGSGAKPRGQSTRRKRSGFIVVCTR